MSKTDKVFGIHVRLVRDEDDTAIHDAEQNDELPAETISFGTYFYCDPAAMEDYLNMKSVLDEHLDERCG